MDFGERCLHVPDVWHGGNPFSEPFLIYKMWPIAIALLGGQNEIVCLKHLAQSLAHGVYLISARPLLASCPRQFPSMPSHQFLG